MIKTILRREMLDNLLSLRFTLPFVLILLLFVTSNLMFTFNYRMDERDYWNETNNNLSVLRNKSEKLIELTFHKQKLWKKPLPFMFLAEGFDNNLPNKYELNIFEMEYPAVSNRMNTLSPSSNRLDIVFIVSILLSLVAVFLTYDSICGEKENGTLRLILSGEVSRNQILLAKYFSATLTMALPIITGLLISLIIVAVSKTITIGLQELTAIVLFFFVSLLYISIFILLGLFISAIMKHSTNSIVLLLVIWVVWVILVPSLGEIVSNVLYKIPTYTEISRKSEETFKDIWNQAHTGKFGPNAIATGQNRNSPWFNPTSYMKHHQAHEKAGDKIFADYHNQMISQAYHARNLLGFSPTILYQKIMESMTGTGIRRSIRMYEQVRKYKTQLKDYIRLKDSEDPESFHEIYNSKNVAQWWNSISHKPVDFDFVPKFKEKVLGLGESLQLAIWDIGLLALFNLAFFTAAFVAFLKYDVR